MPPTGSKTLDDWIAPRRAAAIARIVKAVGQPPRDEMLMAADIFQASCEKPSALVLQEGSQALKVLKKVRRIRKSVEKQAALIEADPYIRTTIEMPMVTLALALRDVE